jgi:hypothetical protein
LEIKLEEKNYFCKTRREQVAKKICKKVKLARCAGTAFFYKTLNLIYKDNVCLTNK